MDQSKVESLVERFFDLNAGMSCLNLYLGHRLGLFQALVDAGPVTSKQVSRRWRSYR
ncbi:MAG: hypothetical protein OTJ97_07910 [SAR202 cluster bacterium]|nr:hypothetical protein [SAR202 cluster bacterium]